MARGVRVRYSRRLLEVLALVSLKPAPQGWEDAILDAAVQFMNAEVCFYEVESDDEDDITGTGSVSVRILWRGKARVQQLRSPRDSSTEYQASDSRAFRFQLDPGDSVPEVYSGTKARVLAGGRDSGLEALAFVVDSAINSSHKAVRTVELTSNMRPVNWTWGPPSGFVDGTVTWPNGQSVTFHREGDIVTASVSPASTIVNTALPFPAEYFYPAGSQLIYLSHPTEAWLVIVSASPLNGAPGVQFLPLGETPPFEPYSSSYLADPVAVT